MTMYSWARVKYLLLAVFVFSVIFAGLTGCATSGQGTRRVINVPLKKVAIVPFENLSSEPNAGLIVMSNLDSAFRKYSCLDLLNADVVRERLLANEGEFISPRKIGENLGVDTVITGAVTEYRYIYGAGEQPVVGLNIQIISVATGEVYWSEAATTTGNFSWIREESLAEVTEEVALSLVRDFNRSYHGCSGR